MPMTEEQHDADVVELEPTTQFARADPMTAGFADRSRAGVGLVEGTLASLAGETGTLRRSRLAAAALYLIVLYATLFVWSLFSGMNGLPVNWLVMVARLIVAATVAGLLLSPVAMKEWQVRAAEVALFGGLTALLVVSLYTVSLVLIRRDDLPAMIAFIKNGALQMFMLMMLYGTFIPNHPRTVAKVVLAMALAPLFALAFLSEHPEANQMLEQFRSVEQTGSNALFLLLGAGMAIYGSVILNGLRAELHAAKKFGQYRLVRKLGAGGMGEVYLAEHELLKRPCALKLIKSEGTGDQLALARFEREVRSSSRLSHPNTIEIFDYGHTDDGTFYYVMEYLKGLSLGDLVRREGPLPPGRVIYLFRQVCGGLAEAHGLGLVHRDLKPANVFVAVRGGESDVAKVLDFGLVKLTNDTDAVDLTSDNLVSGTPLFMPPEQATGEKNLDARADIYALGAMMYYALTAQPPFSGATAFAVMMAHARDPVTPPSQIRPEIPNDLEQVVLRCLEKRPADRYPNVKALSQSLAACASASEWGANRADAWWASQGIHETG